jgi:molecular chaperone DnaJ
VLGVARTAGPEEVKQAFRTLALRWHPDRNPGDAQAEARFREIAEAWDVLGDPEKRARFDRLGALYTHDGKPPRPEELNEILLDALGGLFGRQKAGDRGEDLRYTLVLSLEDAARGVERSVTVLRTLTCRDCAGTGDAAEGRVACEPCKGTGRSATRRFLRNDCAHCAGKGYRRAARCGGWGGAGRPTAEEQLRVKVPPGVATGQKLKLRGKGNDGPGVLGGVEGPPGDLLVVIDVEDHPLFRRRGNDLLCEVPIRFADAALGAEVTVPTLDGTTRIRVPPGTPSGKSFRLPGRGVPAHDGGGRGDLHARVVVEVPATLPPEAVAALEEFSKRAGETAHPRRAAWLDALRERGA